MTQAHSSVLPISVIVAAALTACAPHPVAPTSLPPQATLTRFNYAAATRVVEVTFYAAADNDPPDSTDIAHPNSRHGAAGGTGTFDDPLTLATDPREIRPGVAIYYPPLQKYFVMEDDCGPCIDQWNVDRTPHVDLWAAATTDPAVRTCEAALTPDQPSAIIVDPPPDLPVDRRPIYDSNGRCWPNT